MTMRPPHADDHLSLGVLLAQQNRLDEALQEFKRALALRPDDPRAHYCIGKALVEQGRLDEAITAYRQAIAHAPSYAEAYNNLGNALRAAGRIDEAIAALREAISCRPGYANATLNLAWALLLKGDFEQGWPAYEARFLTQRYGAQQHFPLPRWDGGELAGRRILLWADQGLGDTIQFVRYAPLLAARGGEVIVQCQPELKRLLQSNGGELRATVVARGEPLPEFDVHCPLLSVPNALGTRMETIPADVPYLTADDALVEQWRGRLGEQLGLRIGVVWAGSPTDRRRSVSLAELAALGSVPAVRLISLQKGDAAQQARTPPAGLRLTDFAAELNDFADTAALVANLDLVISVDTAVAHLAGALGKPIWLLLPFAPDWRWLLDRNDSPWYPTMRLFRQPCPGDWSTPLQEITARLAEMGG